LKITVLLNLIKPTVIYTNLKESYILTYLIKLLLKIGMNIFLKMVFMQTIKGTNGYMNRFGSNLKTGYKIF